MKFHWIVGVLAILLSGITLFGYITRNDKLFRKKEIMQKFWGRRIGTAIHFIAYAVIPFVFGCIVLWTAFSNRSAGISASL